MGGGRLLHIGVLTIEYKHDLFYWMEIPDTEYVGWYISGHERHKQP